MRKKRQISHTEKLQTIYIATPSSSMVSGRPYVLSMGYTESFSTKEDSMEMWGVTLG